MFGSEFPETIKHTRLGRSELQGDQPASIIFISYPRLLPLFWESPPRKCVEME